MFTHLLDTAVLYNWYKQERRKNNEANKKKSILRWNVINLKVGWWEKFPIETAFFLPVDKYGSDLVVVSILMDTRLRLLSWKQKR